MLVEHGRAAISKREYSEAADFLSAALARKVEAHGELADECAELYYLYGSALTMEAEIADGDSLFGPAVPSKVAIPGNVSDAGDEASGDKGGQEASGEGSVAGAEAEAEAEASAASGGEEAAADVASGGAGADDAEEEDEDDPDFDVEEGERAAAESAAASEEEGAEGAKESAEADAGRSGAGEEPAEDPDLRTQAWQILETARVILGRRASRPKRDTLMLADVHMRLGDLNLYNERYADSYEDYSRCRELRLQVCDPSDRAITEAEYISGLAQLYAGNKTEALEHFRRAAESCRLRIAQEVARAGAAGAAQPTPEAQALTQILKDIEARIEEEELEVPVDAGELAQDPQAPLQGVAAEQEAEFEAVELPPPRKRGRGGDAAAGTGAAAEARGEGTDTDGGAAGEAGADGGAEEAESPRGKTRRTGT